MIGGSRATTGEFSPQSLRSAPSRICQLARDCTGTRGSSGAGAWRRPTAAQEGAPQRGGEVLRLHLPQTWFPSRRLPYGIARRAAFQGQFGSPLRRTESRSRSAKRSAGADRYLGMHPEVAAGETTTFPSTISALTDDAPHMQGASSRPAPVACAALNASTPTTAAMTTQTLTRRRRPQNLTTRGCRAATRNAMGRVAHLRPRRVPSLVFGVKRGSQP